MTKRTKRETIFAAVPGGNVPVIGYAVGPFTVHKSISDPTVWVITHRATGFCFPRIKTKTAKQAIKIASGFIPGIAWNRLKRSGDGMHIAKTFRARVLKRYAEMGLPTS